MERYDECARIKQKDLTDSEQLAALLTEQFVLRKAHAASNFAVARTSASRCVKDVI